MEDLEIGQEKPAEKCYPYFAFISYKRSDSRLAAWLHRELNWYRFPNKLVEPANHPPHPRYIRPVLRDKNNLEVNRDSFWESIKEQLNQSRFLIVLCSPESAKSPYVNDEIEYFLDSKNDENAFDYILPVIIKGNPGKGDETECLPKALQRPEIIERNLPTVIPDEDEKESIARDRGLTRIVSFLLRVSHEKIRDDYRLVQQRQTRIKLAIASAAVIILTIISGWAVFERNLKETARKDAVTALAKAEFQEASRLLDNGETCLGLAHLGSALKNIPFSPAIERANGLILNRSWMIKTASYDLKAKLTGKMFSPGFEYILRVSQNDVSPVLELRKPFSNSTPRALVLPSKDIKTLLFTKDGIGLLALSDVNGKRQYNLWQLKDLTKTAEYILPEGSEFINASRSGKLAAMTTKANTLEIIDTVSGNALTQFTKKDGNTWIGLDIDDGIAAAAQGHLAGDQNSYLQSIDPENRSKYTIKCIRFQDGKTLSQLDGIGQISHLNIAPGGNFLVFVREVIQEPTRLEIVPLIPDLAHRSIDIEGNIKKLAISPDGIHVSMEIRKKMDTYGTKAQVLIYDLFNGRETGTPFYLPDTVKDWAFSHDGRRLALLTKSSTLHLLKVSTGKVAAEPLQLPYEVHRIDFSPSDRHVRFQTPGEFAELTVQVTPVVPRRILPSSPVETVVIKSVVVDPQSRFLTFLLKAGGAGGGAIDIHHLETEKNIADKITKRIEAEPNCGAFSPDGKLFALGLIDIASGEARGVAYVYKIPKTDFLNPNNWEILKKIVLPSPISKVSFSRNGNWLLLAEDASVKTSKTLSIYNCLENKLEPSFISHEESIDDACFSWDSRNVITGGSDKVIRVWDIAAGKQAQEIQCREFPEFVACIPNGNIIYVGRFLNVNSEVAVFQKNGKSLWRKHFGFGIGHMAINSSGNLLALGSLGKKACVFNIETGQQLTEWITQRQPISSLGFIQSGLREALAVGGHDPHIPFTEKEATGEMKVWDISTFREISDTVQHGDGVKGIMQMSDGRICSYNFESAVVSPNPLSHGTQTKDRETLISILGKLSGIMLDQQGVSKLYQPMEESKTAISETGQSVLKWLRKPLEERCIEPDSKIMIMERLKALSRGGLEEYEMALDIAPDYTPVLSDYWFPVARETAEKDYMRAAKNKSAFEKEILSMKWDGMTGTEKMQAILKNKKAFRMADFWTNQACIKAPESAEVWGERALFLRHKGSVDEYITALSKAAELDPDKLSIQYYLYHQMHIFDKKEPAYILNKLKLLCNKITAPKTEELGMICQYLRH